MSHEPIRPFSQLEDWAATLTAVSIQGLELCEKFPQIARRFEAWWAGEALDRPILIGASNRDPSRPINRRLYLLKEPEAWLEAKLKDLQQIHWVADAVPHIRVDFGPVLLGALFGGRTEFASDTSWTHAFIQDDWSNEPDWSISPDNESWILLKKLLRLTAADAVGRYLVCTPDLGAPADVLLNLRGSSQLCLDVVNNPTRLVRAQAAMYGAWRMAFSELYTATAGEHGAGLFHWYCLWSNRPYHYPACDFNFMIGPDHFSDLCLTHIERQTATVGRACFHVDGPGATRHVDALLEVDTIQAIQFTPGAGSPSALKWLNMLKKIQAKGRSLLVFSPAGEVLELCEQLKPDGLAILLEVPPSPGELDALYAALCSRFGCAP